MPGRKSKYNSKMKSRIVELIKRDSFTVAEICRQLKIDQTTYNSWLKEFPDLAEAVSNAKEELMQSLAIEAKNSLRKKIQGYTSDETQITTVPGVDGRPSIKEQKVKHIYFQPDTAAIIFALTNADPEHWKNRQNSEITGKDGKSLFGDLNIEDLKKKAKELQNKIDV
jgi:transposase-like protein